NNTGTKLWDYQAKDDIYSVAISPDTSFIAAGSWDDTLYVLDMEGKEFWNASCGGNINCVSISLDSSTLAAASDDGSAYLFERNPMVFARLFGDSFLSNKEIRESDIDKERETGIPLNEGTSTTEGIENIVEIASASSGENSADINNKANLGTENYGSLGDSSELSGLLNF